MSVDDMVSEQIVHATYTACDVRRTMLISTDEDLVSFDVRQHATSKEELSRLFVNTS
jgi:hypothetical protein